MPGVRLLIVAAFGLAVWYARGWDLGFAWIDQLHDIADSLAWIAEGRLLPQRGTTVSGLGHNGPWSTFMTMTALRLWHAEWAVAALAAAGTLTAVALGLWAAVRRAQPAAVWAILLVWTQPHLWEWSRVGLDVSFAPLPALGLLTCVVAAGRGLPLAAAAGFFGALVAQSHPSLFPAVAVVLVATLWTGAPRASAFHWALALAGGAVAYAGVLAKGQLGAGGLTWLGPGEQLRLLPALVDAPGRALAVRLEALDYNGLGILLRWAGWLLPVGMTVQALRRRASRPALVALAAAVASLAALGYDEQSHYHHLMHWDGWLAAVAVGTAWTFAGSGRGRALLWAVLVLQMAAVGLLQRQAAREGIVAPASVFALHEPGRLESAATWRLRRALFAALAADGAATPPSRARVGGDAALPLAEHGWWSPLDDRPGDSLGEGAWLLQNCRSGGLPLTGGLCLLSSTAALRWRLLGQEGAQITEDVAEWRNRAGAPGPGRAHLPPLSVARSRFPLHLEPAEVADAAGEWTLRLRMPRHPLALAADGEANLTVVIDGRAMVPLRTQAGYILDEAVYRVPARKIEVRVDGRDPRPVVFDVFIDPPGQGATGGH